ncbi:MAG: hypothetical protein KJ060_12655 [Candidatus Hydrogenedentes bacterium]|nr:hypothetical protein [Candidatus Hydrogenedentota bacterium]
MLGWTRPFLFKPSDWTIERAAGILMRGVSTTNFRAVLPAMAESAAMSKGAASREFVDASEAKLKELMERRFHDAGSLAI